MSAIIENRSYDLDVDADQSPDPLNGELTIRVRGRMIKLDILEQRRKKMKDAATAHFAAAGTIAITSPMPGKVLRCLVTEGQSVKKGDGLVVIEAMKMENELQAPKDGVIKTVAALAGSPVDGGSLLLVIE